MDFILTILPILGMFLVMYFFFIRPEKKRNMEYNEMISNLAKNDEIITRGGIIGKIVTINNDDLVIVTGPDKVKIKITKTGVAMKASSMK